MLPPTIDTVSPLTGVRAAIEARFIATARSRDVALSQAEIGQLLRGIYQFGFEKPSAIQQRAILPIIQGRDVIAQAQSGTGKTSLIAITLCQMLDTTLRE